MDRYERYLEEVKKIENGDNEELKHALLFATKAHANQEPDELARKVKLADLADNIKRCDIKPKLEKDGTPKIDKYLWAKGYLEGVE